MRRTFNKLAAIVALLGAGSIAASGTGSSFLPTHQSVRVKDATSNMPVVPRPQQKSIHGGLRNPYKIYKKVYKNQQQYREMLRSNPSFRNSRKNKLN